MRRAATSEGHEATTETKEADQQQRRHSRSGAKGRGAGGSCREAGSRRERWDWGAERLYDPIYCAVEGPAPVGLCQRPSAPAAAAASQLP